MKKDFSNIKAEEVILGDNVFISKSASIRGLNGKAKKVEIGDNTYIGDNVQIILDNFKIGDFCKVHHHTNFHGYKPLTIGHNAWIGQGTIVDSIGSTTIGNNCGIGAGSQLWTHIRHGDPLEGCNYESSSPLVIGNDVWFVGRSIVSPITAKDKSMALAGSIITKDMEENRIYAGSPAKDVTDKIKPQFTPISIDEKRKIMSRFELLPNIVLIEDDSEIKNDNRSYFNILSRKYTKKRSKDEIKFMLELQSNLIKFTPY